MLESIALGRESRILDLACGNGVFTHHLARISDFTVGLDMSSHLLAENRYGRLVCGDAHVLPFSDESFDVVFEANLLHHVTDPAAVIEQMKRVSCRCLVFVEPNRLNPLMFLFSLAVPAERGVLRSSERALKDLVERCGLRFRSALTTGMISQNNTPGFLVPWLKRFDRQIWWGNTLSSWPKSSITCAGVALVLCATTLASSPRGGRKLLCCAG